MRDFEDYTLDEIESLFQDMNDDLEMLEALAGELQHRKDQNSGMLRFKIIASMAALRRGRPTGGGRQARASTPPSGDTHEGTSERFLPALLARYGLRAADGRPLHGYRLDGSTFSDAERSLIKRARTGALANPNREDAALFVLWAAEWFRREYRGGLRKYEDFRYRLNVDFDQAHWRSLIDEGLQWWRRPVVERSGARHRLLTIALEGGFPARVLEEQGDGWLARYLTEVVGRLLALADPNEEAAETLAVECSDKLKETYRYEDFCQLAASLAYAVVQLRREAMTAGPGLQASTVLDTVHPGWRETLPIASEGEAARRLIDGMLSTPAFSIGGGELGVTRLLEFDGAVWRPGVRLGLSGKVSASLLPMLRPSDGRVRVHAHGALARVVTTELALLDPPGDSEGVWLIRPLTTTRDIFGIPFRALVEVSLYAGGRLMDTVVWPRGEKATGELLPVSRTVS